MPLRVLQAGKPVVPVAVLNTQAAALARPVAKLAAATAVQAAADRQAAAPAALDAEHVAAVPALQAAAGPVDAAAQTHKAVGTGVAATDEQPSCS
ncbi:regulatory protein AlgP [Escherichia coli]|uniref:Regulatory protein AlgP n=1 Tax=Escherichia coli TaxID=562 RepID=A0A376U5N7_ECOLX|nr:regulatory protein AlgP [Escherichia coli]